MSRFFNKKYSGLEPYTPGEQPQDMQYIKLNTNESPFDVPESVVRAAAKAAERLRLYPDPTCAALIRKLSDVTGLNEDQLIINNGSDEGLYFAFLAFCGGESPAVFPDITYGFYPVFAGFCGVPYEEIPLKDDFSIDINDYIGINKNIFIANPNAPTGIALAASEIEKILASNPDNIVLIDEAYVDFGAESCLPLVNKYDNLIVTQTFSKSRSLAGARLGFAAASPEIIRDMNTIRFSTNPYNINAMTMAAGIASLEAQDCTKANCLKIQENRAYTADALKGLGFEVLDSRSNFIFARHPRTDGGDLYLKLKENGILVRHFEKPRIKDFIRITIGTREQMEAFISKVKELI